MLCFMLISQRMTNSGNKIRVRFAPSPTGHLHVGGARTALYNWLFARSQGGSFILRIEDTDLSRSTEEAIRQIISSMGWLGLDWDEGPEKGGAFGPYRQMERMDLYQKASGELLEIGAAYRCYCTTEEIEAERQEAKKSGRAYVYSGRCATLTAAQEQACRAEGRDPVVRLRVPGEGSTTVNDLLRGEVVFENSLIGDIILVRSSGVPTYNFAVAVDDSQMMISHVIRGDDHLPNTPKQLLVLKALGKEPPQYAHLSLILGSDRTPLSKRHGSSSVEEFRSQGYVREALDNYLALLGWSYDAETTIFSVEDLINKFSLDRVGSTAAVFDNDKLLWMNGHYLRGMEPVELQLRVEEFLKGTELAGLPGTEGRPTVAELLPLVQEKMKTLKDFVDLTGFFFLPLKYEEKALEKLRGDSMAPAILEKTAVILAQLTTFQIEPIETGLREASAAMDIKLGKFLQPIRIAISGKTVTPGMFESLAVLGKEKSIERIDAAAHMI